MADICVAHLVRRKNGLEPFRKFLESYFRNDAGMDHDLLIIYKGFRSGRDTAEYEKLLGSYPHRTFFVRDFGFDIRSYLLALRSFPYRYFCFFNSYSEILSERWLEKMYRHISREDVGLVGATGSWQSMYTDAVNWKITLQTHPLWKYLASNFCKLTRLVRFRCYFPPFPNYHIRSNAFMVKRETMLRVKCRPILRKIDAWRFESGSDSLTWQVIRMGLRVLVVGKDGVGHGKEMWRESGAYKQHDQWNLLVADNQTRLYEFGDDSRRSELAFQAWGDDSKVAVPSSSLCEE